MIDEVWRLVTPFSEWWQYALAYAAGFWVVTTGLLRFGPRECKTTYVERVPVRYEYECSSGKRVEVPEHDVVARYTPSECMGRFHMTHVIMRQFAVLFGFFWPIIPVLAVPWVAVRLFFKSMYRIGRVEAIAPGEVK